MESVDGPIFSAVSNSTHHLYILLRCIGFASKASVQISSHGIRFSVDDGRVMQGLAFLDKALFTSYIFNPIAHEPPDNGEAHEEEEQEDSFSGPRFLISLSALVETLQIFGLSDSSPSNNAPASIQAGSGALNAFSTSAVLLNRSCTISYVQPGSPLSITLAEAGVTTTCDLTTYEPDDPTFDHSPGDMDIPFQRDAIVFKVIMRSTFLHNAITELDSTSPTVLSLTASATKAPFFALSVSGGPFSESTVEFSIDKESGNANDPAFRNVDDPSSSRQRPTRAKLAPTVTETFLVNPPSSRSRVRQSYRYSLIHKALRAMAVSSKVSIRCDRQGVLSLQFMIELGESSTTDASVGGQQSSTISPGNVSFVDFRFVPLVDEEGNGSEDDDEEVE